MSLNQLIGTELDAIGLGTRKVPGYKILLFDLYQDDISDIVLDRFQQVPLDITAYVENVDITISHDGESNQCSVNVFGNYLDYRVFMFSWVKVYEGDVRVDANNWPCVFSGVFKGQPGRANTRGNARMYSHTAYDRSVFYKQKRIISRKVWLPEDISGTNIGEICVEIATNAEWGMKLDRQEVLFGKFYRTDGITEWLINKKLQIVDILPMEALRNIMQVVQKIPAFNGEGKLVARSMDIGKNPIRIYQNEDLIESVDIPQNNTNLPTSIVVKGQDFKTQRLDYNYQRLRKLGPTAFGIFSPTVTYKEETISDDSNYRAVFDTYGKNITFEGTFLGALFALDSDVSITVTAIDDFSCKIVVEFEGVWQAIIILTVLFFAYIAIEEIASQMGSVPALAWLGWALRAGNALLLQMVIQTMQAIGNFEFELWGTPFEYVYRELEAKAYLADTADEEDNPEVIQNYILGTLEDCEALAKDLLRRKVTEIAGRRIVVSSDLLLEPNDVIELSEEGTIARYYIQEVSKTLNRGSKPTYDLSVFRVR